MLILNILLILCINLFLVDKNVRLFLNNNFLYSFIIPIFEIKLIHYADYSLER
jgi:hypothetical protein